MMNSSISYAFLFIFLVLAKGCQPISYHQALCQKGEAFPAQKAPVIELLAARVEGGPYRQKVDNLLLLIDDSVGLLECQGNQTIRRRAFALLDRIEASLVGIDLHSGIRIFGPHADKIGPQSSLLYCMADTQPDSLRPSVITITPENPMLNPLAMALDSTYLELKQVKGNTAVILLSDFRTFDSEVRETLDMITQYYSDHLCLYGVYLGDEKEQNEYLNNILGLNICGFFSEEAVLNEPAQLTDFLEKVLFDPVPVEIPSIMPPPTETAQAKSGMAKVAEMRPETMGVEKPDLSYSTLQVEKELRIELKTQFDFGKAAIKPEYIPHLKAIADFMKTYPDTTTVIEGHTCTIGSAEFNMRLSAQRAEAVRAYLVDTLGVEPTRITTKAYGLTRPKADNSTEAGRIINRRAEAVITTKVLEEVKGSHKGLGRY